MIKIKKFLFSTRNEKELKKFANIKDWWDPNGSSKALHAYNKRRVEFIKKILLHRKTPKKDFYFLEDLNVLDVGCGGGLLSESMALVGGQVIGIDDSENSILISKNHLENNSQKLKQNLTYKKCRVEDLSQNEKYLNYFDVVTSMEVIEHVNNQNLFLEEISKLTKLNGLFFISSLSKNLLSYFLTIFMAEKVLGIVENGTHDYNNYLTIEELTKKTEQFGFQKIAQQNYIYNPLNGEMEKGGPEINYLLCFEKIKQFNQSTMQFWY